MGTPTECQFIAWGLTKDGYPCIAPENVQDWIDDPYMLDDEHPDFLRDFYKYFDWYWRDQNAKRVLT